MQATSQDIEPNDSFEQMLSDEYFKAIKNGTLEGILRARYVTTNDGKFIVHVL